ncbi:uncharacterized protein [Asterias amurensis]|uniref:uncharacterized protein n=1 Tax=Asterias amurensis TaxID=7602 RepID=UPI003AB8076A
MTDKYSRMERGQNWLNFRVIMSFICIATCNTANQMEHDASGFAVVSSQSLVATLDHSSDNSDSTDSQHIPDTNMKPSPLEIGPVYSNSQEAAEHKPSFTRSYSQNSEHNLKTSIEENFLKNYWIKTRQLSETIKSKVPVIRFLLHSRSEDDSFRNNLQSRKIRIGQKRLRLRREIPPAENSIGISVTKSGRTTTESHTEKSTTSERAATSTSSNDLQVTGKTDKVLNREVPKLVDTKLKSTVPVSGQNPEVPEKILELEDPNNMTTLMNSSVQVTTVSPVRQGTSQSGTKALTTSSVEVTSESQVDIDGNQNLAEDQEVVPQTSISPKHTSSKQEPNEPRTTQPPQTKPPPILTTSTVPKSSKTTVPMTTNNILLLITNDTSIGSQVEDIHERMSDNELDSALLQTNDAYWALGSLTTVLLLLTAAVLFTGLWKKRNHMSNPISDVTCHPSPERKRKKTDLKDFLKKKLRHIKTLNLKDSPLTGSMEMKKYYNGRRNGKSNGAYSHRYDTVPLLVGPDDEEEDEFIEWEQCEKDHSV